MPCEGEHIEAFRLPGFVTELCKEAEVAGEGLGPAGNVNDPGGVHGNCGPDEFGCGALAGRIHEKDVRGFAVFGEGSHKLSGVSLDEAGVFDMIPAGVFDGVFDGLYRSDGGCGIGRRRHPV